VVFCEGELIVLCETQFSVLFCLVTAVHRCHSRLAINKVASGRSIEIGTYEFDTTYIWSLTKLRPEIGNLHLHTQGRIFTPE